MHTIRKLLFLAFLIILPSALTACAEDTSLEVEKASIEDVFLIDEFAPEAIDLVFTEGDETKTISLSENMLEEPIPETEGTHTLTAEYEGETVTFEVTLRGALTAQLMTIHEMGVASGEIDKDYEEWLESIRGEDGVGIETAEIDDAGELVLTFSDGTEEHVGRVTGEDGREVELNVTDDNELEWRYADEDEWQSLMDLDVLQGDAGDDGEDGRETDFRVEDEKIQWQYAGDDDWQTLITPDVLEGEDGDDGVSVENASINDDGELILELSDGSDITAGEVTGADGREVELRADDDHIQWRYDDEDTWTDLVPVNDLEGEAGEDGAGIDDVNINDDGELIVTLTNGTEENAGNVVTFHTVRFFGQDGFLRDVQFVLDGDDAEAPEAPELEGHDFKGWDTSFEEVTENLKVKAEYEAHTYDVYFETHGDTLADPVEDVEHGSTIDLPIPERKSYDFEGWYTSDSPNARKFTEESSVRSGLVLHAQWSVSTYFVEFTDHEGAALSTAFVKHGNDILPPEAPERESYEFIGWSDSPDTITRDKTITTEYARIYKETFENFDEPGSSYVYGDFLGTEGIPWYYNGARGDIMLNGEHAMTFRDAGHSLEAWIPTGMDTFSIDYTNAFSGEAGLAVYADDELIAEAPPVLGSVETLELEELDIEGPFELRISPEPSNQVTIGNIRWTSSSEKELHTVDVSFDQDKGEVDGEGAYLEGETVELTATPHEGHSFIGWSNHLESDSRTISFEMPAEAVELDALFETKTFDLELSYAEDKGTIEGYEDKTFEYGERVTLSASAEEGHRFLFWEGYIFSTEATITFDMPAEDVFLEALFEKTFTVHVDYDDGKGHIEGVGDYVEGEYVTLTAVPDEGYAFTGWEGFKESSDSTITFEMPASDISLSADFEETEEHDPVLYEENFENFDEPGTGYQTGSFTGVEGIQWDYDGARGDMDLNGEQAMTLRDAGHSLEAEIPTGMETFSIDYTNAFSSEAGLAIYADDERIGTAPPVHGSIETLHLENLGIEGPFTLRIQPDPSAQVTFNNMMWSIETQDDFHTVTLDTDYAFADLAVSESGLIAEGTSVTIEVTEESGHAPFKHWLDDTGEVFTKEKSFTHTVTGDVAFTAVFDEAAIEVESDGEYIDPERVAKYLHTYGELPGNYMAYSDFEDTGWSVSELRDKTGNPLKSLGYKHFSNYEGLLPDAPERTWRTADINFDGGHLRGVERLVFSNDGLIYYTDDHYDSYLHMYGEE